MVILFYSSTRNAWALQLFHMSTLTIFNIYCFRYFDIYMYYNPLVILFCILCCICRNWKLMMSIIFSYMCWPYRLPLGSVLWSSSVFSILKGFTLFQYWFAEILCIFGIWVLCCIWALHIYSPSLWLLFYFNNGLLCINTLVFIKSYLWICSSCG